MEGYTVTTTDLQTASNLIALQVFQTLKNNAFVFSDANIQGAFAPEQIVATDAGAGVSYLQSLYPGLDYAVWGGTLFARTALNDQTYFGDYNINLTPGSTDCQAITDTKWERIDDNIDDRVRQRICEHHEQW